MFDTPDPGPQDRSPAKSPIFYAIELARLADGNVYVSLTATTVDGEKTHLLSKEIAYETVPTIDCALTVIQAGLRVRLLARPMKEFCQKLGENYFRLDIPERPDSPRVEKLVQEFKLIQKHIVQDSDNSWQIGPMEE
ncbi:hypothetical protein G6321_00053550 [Bradyrhizobium barranii subsp. barranii]|uniref:Uncharacterized protein n=1 Tax=Bradyrhizobium barranii subsp. barranii TaxID=2823807 RepID=A0A7Z0Q879_9BRAD|nr:hypothetical protein [Bradyrhizobium barranii]UGX94271.1 hypothetical protein G6321_00053550 [Bradyrhizobium barranii subsp. barranii]